MKPSTQSPNLIETPDGSQGIQDIVEYPNQSPAPDQQALDSWNNPFLRFQSNMTREMGRYVSESLGKNERKILETGSGAPKRESRPVRGGRATELCDEGLPNWNRPLIRLSLKRSKSH